MVPPEEDYLDYRPIEAALCPWLHGLSEYITLTRINVARFRFRDFMVSSFDITEAGRKILTLHSPSCESGPIYILYLLHQISLTAFAVN